MRHWISYIIEKSFELNNYNYNCYYIDVQKNKFLKTLSKNGIYSGYLSEK